MNLGTLIRNHRKALRLTLKSVAEKAGVSEGFMSQVENNVKSPSLATLRQICESLGVSLSDLMGELENQETLFPVRKADWGELEISHTGFATHRFVGPDQRSVIDSAVLLLQPGRSLPVRSDVKNGQELLCLLQGRLELVKGDRQVLLEPGDAVHFWAEPDRQRITNPGPELAVALWVGTL